MNRYFYGIKCEEELMQSAFDLLVILASQQKERITPSHITIQGPFEKPKRHLGELKSKEARISGTEIFETPAGAAFVLLVEMDGIRDVWQKFDYPDGTPHLTIFQGKKDFCKKLCNEINKIDFKQFHFSATDLQRINIKKKPAQEFENYESIKRLYNWIFPKEWPGPDQIAQMPEEDKVKCVVSTFKRMMKLKPPGTKMPSALTPPKRQIGALFD